MTTPRNGRLGDFQGIHPCSDVEGHTVQGVLLKGRRVLVMEDEVLIALDLELVCRDLGADDVTIVRMLDDVAVGEPAAAVFDMAILDLTLAGRSTVEFACGLRERGIPFVFTTGYSDPERFPEHLSDVPIVGKPFSSATLAKAIAQALESHGSPA